ncbi:MAG: Gfo/Idh/MocA family oxidoreductase, partial [Chloroflexi bacterium]|nr:Gfo/Idh/MocA family oxidoreductase [Chloroflexota bacterium]
VIQVGIGGMGNAWLNAMQASPDVEYAGFVEVSDKVAAEQVKKYNLDGSTIYKSLDEALRYLKPDGVINVTPPQFHKAVSLTALQAGMPVLSEKPLAGTRQEALDIVEVANRTGVLHMVTQNYRYSVPTQTLKKALDAGHMGEIGAVHIEFFKGPHFGGFREEMPYPLIIDMSIHHFDLMRFFLGSDPVAVFGRSWNPPWSWFKGDASASVTLTFDNNVVVSYNGSWCSQGHETPWNAHWRFECAKGVVFMQDDQVYTQLTNQAPVLVEPVQLVRTGQAYLLQEFYEAVTQGKPPVTTCQDNIKSLGIVFDVVQSFETGEVVKSLV